MNNLHTSVFRKIYLTEAVLCLTMLLMPAGIIAAFFLFGRQSFVVSSSMACIVFLTAIRLFLMISLANRLAEAADAAADFYHAKNWCLMQSVTEALMLLFHFTLIVIRSQLSGTAVPQLMLLTGGYAFYTIILQSFDYLTKRALLRGFGHIWTLCGGDKSETRRLRLTYWMLLLSLGLLLPLILAYTCKPSLMYLPTCAAVPLILIVQIRITLHARRTAALITALSE